MPSLSFQGRRAVEAQVLAIAGADRARGEGHPHLRQPHLRESEAKNVRVVLVVRLELEGP